MFGRLLVKVIAMPIRSIYGCRPGTWTEQTESLIIDRWGYKLIFGRSFPRLIEKNYFSSHSSLLCLMVCFFFVFPNLHPGSTILHAQNLFLPINLSLSLLSFFFVNNIILTITLQKEETSSSYEYVADLHYTMYHHHHHHHHLKS